MSLAWVAVLASATIAFLLKLSGHALPRRLLDDRRVREVLAAVTIALLAALVAVQTLTTGTSLVLDARTVALVVAAVLLWRRAPFIVVVVAGAVVAAGLRALGWG
jgi:branched-subunit amino acid transport protein